MNIQGLAGLSPTYSTKWSPQNTVNTVAGGAQTPATSSSTQVTISEQAKALAASEDAAAARLAHIKTKPAVQRTDEEAAFVQANDKQLADILAKDPQTRSADEISYMQKAGGLVNTMANLTADEKKLYDELVAKGDTEAVRGLNLVALARMNSGDVTLPNGKTFDPTKAPITADNIRQLFSQMFVGSDGQDAKSFEALAKYLDTAKTATSA